MTHTKTIKRPDGVEWRKEDVDVAFAIQQHTGKPFSIEDLGRCTLLSNPSWNREALCYDMVQIGYIENDRFTSIVETNLTPAEIHAAKLELWAKMKPML